MGINSPIFCFLKSYSCFKWCLITSNKTNLKRNVASQAKIMPLIRYWVESDAGKMKKNNKVRAGIRQTISQCMMKFWEFFIREPIVMVFYSFRMH